MSVPSLSVSVHDRYGPQIRDRIAEKLRARTAAGAYQMLAPSHLTALAATRCGAEPILSFYLQLGPERRIGGAWRTAFHSLASAALKSVTDRSKNLVIEAELSRIETALEQGIPELGRSVVFFVCRNLGLWTQITLSLPLPDGVHFGPRPYLRPLARARDEHDRFVLAVLSQQMNRFFISQIGQVQELLRVRSAPLRKMLAHRAPRERGGLQVTEATKIESRIVAHAAEAVLTYYHGRYLSLSGPAELRSALLHDLPTALQDRDGGVFSVDVRATASQVSAAAERIQRAVEAREEQGTVQHVIDAGPRSAAWGEEATLSALHERRVRTLVVDDSFSKPGIRCRACGCVSETLAGRCRSCTSAQTGMIEDIVEFALEQALDQKAALELVRSETARRMMIEIGPMAALLRW